MAATGRIDASAAQIIQSVVFAWWRQRVEPRQDITLTVVSERSVREVSLDEDTDELSTVNVQSFVDEQEWRLYSNVETRVEVVTRVYQGDDCSHPSFSTLCHASRRFGFYFWNILFVMVCIQRSVTLDYCALYKYSYLLTYVWIVVLLDYVMSVYNKTNSEQSEIVIGNGVRRILVRGSMPPIRLRRRNF